MSETSTTVINVTSNVVSYIHTFLFNVNSFLFEKHYVLKGYIIYIYIYIVFSNLATFYLT